MNRREFLRFSTALGASAFAGSGLWQEALANTFAQSGPGPYGPLQAPDENGLMLPAGFRSRVLARSGQEVAGTGFDWHILPDGGATFRVPGGWVYVSNSEDFFFGTGVGALRFDHEGEIVDAYSICQGTFSNCAGGATPWGTWLSCEERPSGLVHECDPLGAVPQVARPQLGRFEHEAVACDPVDRCFYLTEDLRQGRFYRFTPNRWGDLSAGVLEAAMVDAQGNVTWLLIPEPDFEAGSGVPTRDQAPDSTPFDGGEGIVYSQGRIYFTTKGDDRVWDYDPTTQTLCILYDRSLDAGSQLDGVDNLAVNRGGDLIVAEDHLFDQELVLISPSGVVSPLARLTDDVDTELTGPAFDPWERRLYMSSQRGGPGNLGLTFEISGPFRRNFHC